jgi:dTDP-glucose 4,6-dehydratase
VRDWLGLHSEKVVNLDKLTYAGNPENLSLVNSNPSYVFAHGDIADADLVSRLLHEHRPRAVLNFAAESHVDRSIRGPEDFVQTNITGTFRLLEAVRGWLPSLEREEKALFRFLHVSTDEVYGSLGADDPAFSETSRYEPNSPYSASKAASDHLVRAWHHTYGIPVLVTNCSNNYGPFQFPEKLIPLVICRAWEGKAIPVYGTGSNIRDWLFVSDHCAAVRRVLEAGKPGEVYTIGGNSERTNLQVVHALCDILDEICPDASGPRRRLVSFVQDRPGHDQRYAINNNRIRRELGWAPSETFETGLRKTVLWYLENQNWVSRVVDGSYKEWVGLHYGGEGT